MEQILRQIELGHLVENFTAQRVDVETVVAASGGELQRLGLETIGDRVRLREHAEDLDATASLRRPYQKLWRRKGRTCLT